MQRSVYVCQLSEKKQDEIKKMLTGLLLYEFDGNTEAMKSHHGISLEEAVQLGMDSKIVDIDYHLFSYLSEPMDEKYRLANAAVIAEIVCEDLDVGLPYSTDTLLAQAPVTQEQDDELER